jgi:hypothetical protein
MKGVVQFTVTSSQPYAMLQDILSICAKILFNIEYDT